VFKGKNYQLYDKATAAKNEVSSFLLSVATFCQATAWQQYWQWHSMAAVLTVTKHGSSTDSDTAWQQYWQWHRRHRLRHTVALQWKTINEMQLQRTQWSLFVRHSGHPMYRTAVTVCTAQRSPYVPHSGHGMYRTDDTVCTAQGSLYIPHSGHHTNLYLRCLYI
jgi:hypothetical protein